MVRREICIGKKKKSRKGRKEAATGGEEEGRTTEMGKERAAGTNEKSEGRSGKGATEGHRGDVVSNSSHWRTFEWDDDTELL